MDRLKSTGILFIVLSSYLFALSIPLSIAGDNIAVGVAAFGILLVLLSGDYRNFPSFKPLLFFLIPDLLTMLSQFSLSFLKWSSINHHLIPYFSSYKSFKERRFFERVINVLALSSLIAAVAVFFGAFTHQDVKHFHFDFSHIHFYWHSPVAAWGFLNNHLTAGGVWLLIFFLFMGLALYRRSLFYAFVSFMLFGCILLGQSRAAWFGWLLGVVVFALTVPKRILSKIIIFSLSFAVFFILIFLYPNLKSRFLSSFNPDANYSNRDRVMLWESYLKAYKNYNLKQKLFGAGRKTRELVHKEFVIVFDKSTPKRMHKYVEYHFHGGISHNIYLRYLGETGIIGLCGYLLFWFYMLFVNVKAAFKSPDKRALFYSFVGGYVAFLVMGFFENIFVDATIKMALMFVIGINFYLIDTAEKLLFE